MSRENISHEGMKNRLLTIPKHNGGQSVRSNYTILGFYIQQTKKKNRNICKWTKTVHLPPKLSLKETLIKHQMGGFKKDKALRLASRRGRRESGDKMV